MKSNKEDDWETDSIGSASDLTQLDEAEPVKVTKPTASKSTVPPKKANNLSLDTNKLGWNLPTNDISKAGQLDNISVDSYIVGEEELKAIEKEKSLDPVNTNYKHVYEGLMVRLSKEPPAAVPSSTDAAGSGENQSDKGQK